MKLLEMGKWTDCHMFDNWIEYADSIGAETCHVDITPEIVEGDLDEVPSGERFDNFVVYIKDFPSDQERRFHFCRCQVIDDFLNRGRYDIKYRKMYVRNIAVKRKGRVCGNHFPVFYTDLNKECLGILKPCRHCLEALDYKGYKTANKKGRDRIVEEFDITKFMEMYKIVILPEANHSALEHIFNTYSKDWPKLSYKLRELAGWKCQNCGRVFSGNHSFLHVHHVDEDKTNNNESNLRVLCKDCHDKVHGR